MTGPADAAVVAAVDALLMAAIGLTARSLAASPARDVTLTQWRMLALLAGEPAGSRLTDLADATGMSLPSASRMVNRLISRGFIRSEPHADDRRAVRLLLTESGREVVDSVLGRRHAAVAQALAGRSLSAAFRDEIAVVANCLVHAARGFRP
jgi:DNA-binding MarR family transcriptional regulator